MKKIALITVLCAFMAGQANADIIGVSGPASSAGTFAVEIFNPSDALDDILTNTGMQGFNEAQGVTTTVAYNMDGGAVLAAGSLVNSHMIFLNSSGTASLSHFNVVWTFDAPIIGVMSDSGGFLEAASTGELGNPLTNYTVTGTDTGPAAPFPARGIENNNGGIGPYPNDGYTILGNTITVGMSVTEPGDWIRVITPVPVPGAVLLGVLGLSVVGVKLRKHA